MQQQLGLPVSKGCYLDPAIKHFFGDSFLINGCTQGLFCFKDLEKYKSGKNKLQITVVCLKRSKTSQEIQRTIPFLTHSENMNRGLLLLLVATLYTLGRVQGVQITVAEAEQGVDVALSKLNTGKVGDAYMPVIRLHGEKGHVNYKISGMYFNCGLKPHGRFLLPETLGPQMCGFIRGKNLANPKCYRPMYKRNLGGWFVNLVGDTQVGGHTRRFNYHVQVDHGAINAKEQLLDILLSRELD